MEASIIALVRVTAVLMLTIVPGQAYASSQGHNRASLGGRYGHFTFETRSPLRFAGKKGPTSSWEGGEYFHFALETESGPLYGRLYHEVKNEHVSISPQQALDQVLRRLQKTFKAPRGRIVKIVSRGGSKIPIMAFTGTGGDQIIVGFSNGAGRQVSMDFQQEGAFLRAKKLAPEVEKIVQSLIFQPKQ